MVERSLASPEITWGQIARITLSAGKWKQARRRRLTHSNALKDFSSRVGTIYERKVHSPQFLQIIEQATPYRFLDILRIGSRPSRRSSHFSLESLRAIPWVMCWTQTRVLFPTWWGVGSAWKAAQPDEREQLKKDFHTNPLFSVFVKALSFTLAKVELPIWQFYLEQSNLPRSVVEKTITEFHEEYRLAIQFYRSISSARAFLVWRPWLLESIRLRSPMIHPLNLLQMIALKEKDFELIRLTVTGISSGMMTTG
jgi:phosphoenolpyruvate carboxylase